MLLSELLENIDESMKWAVDRGRDADAVSFAVGAINGGWQAFSGIEFISEGSEDMAIVSTARGYYGDSGVTVTDFRNQVAEFVRSHGDLTVGLLDKGGVLTRFDVVVDQDTDRDGNSIGLVLLLQGYMVKPSVRP